MKLMKVIVAIIIITSILIPHNAICRGNKIIIATSIEILKSIVEEIGGIRVEVFSITSSDIELHQFTLTPQVILQTLTADLIIIDGHVDWEYKLIEQVSIVKKVNPKDISINLMDYKGNLTILDIPSEIGISGKNYHGYWILPENVISIAKIIHGKLIQLDPNWKEYYDENLRRLMNRISVLNEEISRIKTKFYGRKVVLGFLAEQYVAHLFGLEIAAILSLEEGLSLKPITIEKAYRAIKSGCLIIVSDVSSKMPVYNVLRELSKEAGVQIIEVIIVNVKLDYISTMMYNIGKLEKANLNSTLNNDFFNQYILLRTSIATTLIFGFIVAFELIYINRLRRKIINEYNKR